MRGKEKKETKQAVAILALPICIAFGLCFGVTFGAVANDIPKGISFGLAGGAGAGMLLFGILCAVLRNKTNSK